MFDMQVGVMMSRILVAGELNADLILSGLPTLPVLGRELLGTGFQMTMGSSSAITAARMAALGADVAFTGAVGQDDLGQFVLHELRGYGVNADAVHILDMPSGVTIALTYSDDRALLTYPGTIDRYDGANITPELLREFTHLHIGSFFLQTALQPRIATIFEMAHAEGLTTSLDVGWDPAEDWMNNPYLTPALAQTDYFLPNEEETQALSGGESSRLAQQVGKLLVVKRGADGAAAYDNQGRLLASVPTLPFAVVDTTGAGDAFNAGFLFATCVAGDPLVDALRFAAACGAQAVGQVGGATNAPHADTINALLNNT